MLDNKIIQKNKIIFYNDILDDKFADIEDLFEN